MVDSSLTAELCFYNNVVSCLSDLLEISYTYYVHYNYSSLDEFMQTLRMIAGLGFTACLTANNNVVNYHIYFQRFIRHACGNLDSSTSLTQLTEGIAKMVELALGSFRVLNYPDYYKSFVQAITRGINNRPVLSSERRAQAEQLLDLLNHELQRII